MRRAWGRTRTALGATAMVAVALVAAGVGVIAGLSAGLAADARQQAEATAREVAAQVTGVAAKDVGGIDGLNDDAPEVAHVPIQVVDDKGGVLGASKGLRDQPVIAEVEMMGDEPPSRDSGEGEHAVEAGTITLPVDRGGEVTEGEEAADEEDFSLVAVRSVTADGVPVTVYAGASLAEKEQAVSRAGRAMLTGLPAVLAVVAGVAVLVTRRTLRPVEGIRQGMAEITASTDLSRRVPEPAGRDEVALLARTINETLSALEAAVERQRRFVADASHELRSPIASLRTQLEVGLAHPQLLNVDGAAQDTVRLQGLADDLLLLARLDAGEQPGDTPVALPTFVREELTQRVGDRHPVRVTGLADLKVAGARGQLARVLGNLLDNAQRHAATTVRVTVRQDGNRAVLEVADDGDGVPEAERERIFNRFVRLDDARSRDDGGAGLGLAIARDVALRHGGTLTADTAEEGGASFVLRLPLAADG
ncbi:HAMP domain-containing sensor histidine kinase [Streptomyces vastus]|uniref:sensor histidine kinase n=1 Tax=Streptomyces vastus TaxID=285451 RepID=UPI0031D7F2ED